MGVLACNRNGCDNIMCDHYSNKYGYICSECLEELKLKPFKNIETFMNSPKLEPISGFYDWEELLEQEFKSRRED